MTFTMLRGIFASNTPLSATSFCRESPGYAYLVPPRHLACNKIDAVRRADGDLAATLIDLLRFRSNRVNSSLLVERQTFYAKMRTLRESESRQILGNMPSLCPASSWT